MRFLLLCTIFMVSGISFCFSQTIYPVSANFVINTPYSVYLSDYYSGTTPKINFTLTLNDLHELDYHLYFKISIEGNGLKLETKQEAKINATLFPNTPYTLNSTEIQSLLDLNNLNIYGEGKDVILSEGRLPEGIYNICLQGFDFKRNTPVTSKVCRTIWMNLNEPPRVNMPVCGTKINSSLQNILFSWSAVQSVNNDVNSIQYRFRIVEINPDARTPDDAINSSVPVLEKVIEANSYYYSSSDPVLIPGRKYAWRIKAEEKSGKAIFKNYGYSQTCYFIYGDACLSPDTIMFADQNGNRISISWPFQNAATSYQINVEEESSSKVYKYESFYNSYLFSDLNPGKKYDISVQSFCNAFQSAASPTFTFTVSGNNSNSRNCQGFDNATSNSLPSAYLATAKINDTIKVGGYKMKLTSVQGKEGRFAGAGEIYLSNLNVTVPVTFNTIYVSADRELFDGDVYAVSMPVAAWYFKSATTPSDFCTYRKIEKPDKKDNNSNSKSSASPDSALTKSKAAYQIGDTITVNGKIVIVTKDFKPAPGDTIVVNGKTIIVGNNGSAKTSLTSDQQEDVSDILKDVIKKLEKENKDSIKTGKDDVDKFSSMLEEKIKKANVTRSLIVGSKDQYTGQGMSNNFMPPPLFLTPNREDDPIRDMILVHLQLYRRDSTLEIFKEQGKIIDDWDSKTGFQTLQQSILQEIEYLGEDSVEIIFKDEKYKFDFIEKLLRQKLNDMEDDQSMLFYDVDYRSDISNDLTIPNEFFNVQTDSLEKIQAMTDMVINENRLITLVNPDKPMPMPFGMDNILNGIKYIIIFDSLIFNKNGAFINAYTSLKIPGTETNLGFSARRIPFGDNKSGIASWRLMLPKDISIPITGSSRLTILSSSQKSFVEFDCNGFKGIGLDARIEFCRGLLIPELPDGTQLPDPETVKADFQVYTTDVSNILAKISISPFQLSCLPGFGFYVKDAWIDLSDAINPGNMIFPKGYTSNFPDPCLWRGIYIKSLGMRLPAEFQNGEVRKEFGIADFLIDEDGVSGAIYAENLISFDNGSLAGWPFSLDSIAIMFTRNSITGAGFGGKINLPITDPDFGFKYTAVISQGGNYLFSVRPENIVPVPVWGATMYLYETTSITIIKDGNKFLPTAKLCGMLSVEPDLGNNSKSSVFKNVEFQDLIISASSPHIVPGTFSLNSQDHKMNGFSMTLSQIGIVSRGVNESGLYMLFDLHLMKANNNSFSGKGGLTIWGTHQEVNSKQHWVYDHVELDDIGISVDQGAFKIAGLLKIYRQDAVYGDGFNGVVNAEFKPGIQITATALFGNIKGQQYWYVDGFFKKNSGIPISPGFGMYGFGGGIYYQMKQKNQVQNMSSSPEVVSQPVIDPLRPAQTSSGIVYLPDSTIGLGLKATMIAGVYPDPKPFNADATFEIVFNKGGGVNNINIYGSGYLMADLNTRGNNVPVKAVVNILFDFNNDLMHGNFDVYINLGSAVRGRNPGNLAGSAVMHFERSLWYIYLGTPDQRLGINVANLIDINAYFMVGTEIPGMPALPASVTKILNTSSLDFMRDENLLASGGGFAFGGEFVVNTGKKQFMAFYGAFNAGAGFDIMLKNYGTGVTCAGQSSTLGMNGWYASGDVYAFLQGELGLSVDLKFVKGQYKILEIGAAAVLQAKLPNPSWMQGTVGGYYSILGNKIHGNCRFQLTIGEECQITGGSVVAGMNLIQQINPSDGQNKVDVFTNPEVVFNMPIEKDFSMEDLDGSIKTFRVRLEDFSVIENGMKIPGTLEWNSNKDVVAFHSDDILPGNKTCKIYVRIYFEELKNGTWTVVTDKGKRIEEYKEISFQTDAAPDYIPTGNVAYCYPQPGQNNYFIKEDNQGYIILKKGQPDLFNFSNEFIQEMKIYTVNDTAGKFYPLKYAGKTVSFTLPLDLKKDQVYFLDLVNSPTRQNDIQSNLIAMDIQLGDDDGSVALSTSSIQGAYISNVRRSFYSSCFRTSIYNTFLDKINSVQINGSWKKPILELNTIHELGLSMETPEAFDEYDAGKGAESFVRLEGTPYNTWFSSQVNPLLYTSYPLNGTIRVTWRNESVLGLPPMKSVSLTQASSLSAPIINGNYQMSGGGFTQINYSIPLTAYFDYADLKKACAGNYASSFYLNPAVKNILSSPFPPVTSGTYDVYVYYVLPGINKITTIKKLQIRIQ